MPDLLMFLAGLVAFSIIGLRAYKMARRAKKQHEQNRLREHLNWSNHINQPRRPASRTN